MYRSMKLLLATSLTATLAACGGDGGSSEPATGSVSMDLTDAPATDFTNVTVAFTEIRIKPADGEWISFPLEGFETVNLLDLQEGVTEPLIVDEEVPAGRYNGVRLIVDTDQSFLTREETGDSQYTLAVPSGEQSGLKLQGEFFVAADTTTNFTVDFDVSKAIVDPQSDSTADYFLRPSLRLVNNLEVGSITGDVDYATINSARMSDEDAANDCDYEGSVYVYSGEGVTPTDLNVNEPETGPLVVVPVADEGESSPYPYTVAFLTEGPYTLSYACQMDDNETADDLVFEGTQTVNVVAGEEVPAQSIPIVE